MQKTHVAFFMVTVFALGCGPSPEPITSCEAVGDARPLCGWQNPEDMVALPGHTTVIVSEYGGTEGEKSGTLALLDLGTDARIVLFDKDSEPAAAGSTEDPPWGDDECPGPPGAAFSPHGIHLSTRNDGLLQLLVVQHGGRESVEMFEVNTNTGVEDAPVELTWRGCVVAPAGSMLNDVVAGPDDGFFVTHMMDREGSMGPMVSFATSSLFGTNVGHVLAWRPTEGFSVQGGSEGPMPNGIQISSDGETLFVNYSAQGEVRRIDWKTGEVEGSVMLEPLDNSTWAPDGRLLVAAALANPFEMMGCTDLEEGQCPGAFAIVAVDPESLETEVIYEGGPDTPSGAGTVGLWLNDGPLLVGTFAGDRIVRVEPFAGGPAQAD